jgi:hypothetical protein
MDALTQGGEDRDYDDKEESSNLSRVVGGS